MDSLFKQYEGVFAERTEDLKKGKDSFEFAYSPFALQDAIGEKSAKKAWIEYQKLRFTGIEAEEIIHNIMNKIRNMLAIKKGASMEDLEIKKDYTYNKSKKDSKNWGETDLATFYTKLIFAYHESRLGKGELDAAVEKAVLNI